MLTERLLLAPGATVFSPSSPVLASVLSTQTLICSLHYLQQQPEVCDSLSGKLGPRASSVVDMFREKERSVTWEWPEWKFGIR
jgi:hypothetical protein